MPPIFGSLRRNSRLSRCALQYFGRDFFHRESKLKHRSLCPTPPASDFPVGANELHIRLRAQVKQEWRLSTIEFLRERNHRLRIPRRTVRGTVDDDLQGLLFDDVSDVQRQQKSSISGSCEIYGRAITLRGYDCFRCYKSGINHDREF